MVQTVADAVQNGTESKYTYTIQVAARGDAAKSRQEQGEDVTVSTTLGAVEDQMEETAKTKEEASSWQEFWENSREDVEAFRKQKKPHRSRYINRFGGIFLDFHVNVWYNKKAV